ARANDGGRRPEAVRRNSIMQPGVRMRCLITGATGFVGGHLADVLTAAGHQVTGLARAGGSRDATVPFPLYSLDLCETAETERALREVQPEWVFHLAGFASPGRSFHEPAAAWIGNLTATQSPSHAIARARLRPPILFRSA